MSALVPAYDRDRSCDSAEDAIAIDVSAADYTGRPFLRLYIGVTGNVKVDTIFTTGIVYTNVPVGYLRVQGTKVYHTGTTATGIVAEF